MHLQHGCEERCLYLVQASGAQGSMKLLIKGLCLFASNFVCLCNNKGMPCLETLLVTQLGCPSSGSPMGQGVPLKVACAKAPGQHQGCLEPPSVTPFTHEGLPPKCSQLPNTHRDLPAVLLLQNLALEHFPRAQVIVEHLRWAASCGL